MQPVTMVIIGAGGRGTAYANWAAQHPDLAKVVGVAEPREFWRNRLVRDHAIPAKNVFEDWKPLARRKRFADAALVCTLDALHLAPTIALARKGYHILLEKPMAPDERGCRRIATAVQKAGVMVAVGHVMRYTDYTQKLKGLIDSGIIGQVVDIQHLEPVGYWHQAHSFVRGNWRNEAQSSFMLMSKSCHDIDWLHYLMGRRCQQVSSFGTLQHFRRECQPAGAADRCVECRVEPDCPYSARKIYLGRVAKGETGWPVDVLTPDLTMEGVTKAITEGPYGRCVYTCDNDVVDNQVVSMLFEGGRTATFTMTAFNRARDRETRIFGTRGELYGDGRYIHHFDFLTDKTQTVDTQAADGSADYGHGGGDYRLTQAFVAAVANGDRSKILSGPVETLESHLTVFYAEKARRTGRVITVPQAVQS
jgi:predicted dehydrogenase